jgi:hypothetical protein
VHGLGRSLEKGWPPAPREAEKGGRPAVVCKSTDSVNWIWPTRDAGRVPGGQGYVDDGRLPGSEDAETRGSSAIMMDGVIGALADGDQPIAAIGQPLHDDDAGVEHGFHRITE